MRNKNAAAAPQVSVDVQITATHSAPAAEKTAKQSGTVVYCGPSVKGVAKQYTVFHGGVPAPLKEFADKHPAAKTLIVPLEKFAQMRVRLETPGSIEASLFEQVKQQI